MKTVLLKTVLNGRGGTATPMRKGVISDDKIDDMKTADSTKAFIFSLQETE